MINTNNKLLLIIMTDKISHTKKSASKITQQTKITLQTVIAKIIAQNPKNIDVLEKTGLHCLHCPWSTLETLGQGAKAHKWSKGKTKDILNRLNNPFDKISKSKLPHRQCRKGDLKSQTN
ncbi:hypothetical protein CO101_01720 [Candidatus Berkelbacteria bacterium CG_4_9_14_3_um_filter_39_23]|uniref:DUF1858 domain-containing protein n=2 Tax=Candidatus Berkelbacteria TaxID=1618330 RepID=A0A2M7CIX3_9BACT|nr:DUF1858 domain-containing protein [Candidatus Berkelbacteria bacterium]PIR28000.1 MAG: hypothetical protein COV39_01390 [Candidatus Berkelbacteria bacterium CG11_big_fil_rev_8_21_14_0_20_40_23]PIV25574.1 MAG: hypothetical protein COS38_00840 [Candidatus Berkelbacteria bacterium CG03_land_8_20_14_0_80_40_36]PIX30456.1 MAG: hypothetical protein COZ62_02530 [Candidatus Berkelbacteria bacterium CG_4_8_14_3_um_filter_39_27]PIZ28810.1 MAG: hypothetical protein COY44_02215 [Candidatus Berkelbacteri